MFFVAEDQGHGNQFPSPLVLLLSAGVAKNTMIRCTSEVGRMQQQQQQQAASAALHHRGEG